ncbi:MAG: hypothetical protein M1828_005753 [Chrysothrix sp. TS-e1954]|nr:MAG: hypothetical protein M1828_005753 [Chrysothrix sp. TS-e1954]
MITSTHSPNSIASSEHTYLMSTSPCKPQVAKDDSYKPRIISTIGQRPACLVSASVTYVGNNEIYAFGGFDQYTDEVYNHVLRLNLETRQWNLVDNYDDIPGVRMGHTATLWRGEKVLIFGGENEHRSYLSDLIIFDLKTAHWQLPELYGVYPVGRARHSAVIHDDKLFIVGGLSGSDNSTILDDICFLDLTTWTWSRTWKFVPRFDHISWAWGGRLWIFGGLTEGMERVSDIWWLDLKQSPSFSGQLHASSSSQRRSSAHRTPRAGQFAQNQQTHANISSYPANSSSVQVAQSSPASRKPPMAPGSISSIRFFSGPNIPSQALGTHFHAYSSGCLLDFIAPAVTGLFDTSLCALDLETMRWERLADGKELFNPNYRWHYCALNQEGTHAWMLGCPIEPIQNIGGSSNEYLSDVLLLDLRKLGLLGNALAPDSKTDLIRLPTSDTHEISYLSGIGADLARMFDKRPENGSGTDFVVLADSDNQTEEVDETTAMVDLRRDDQPGSKSIHVHRLILEARWPHFARMIASQMAEFHSKKLHIPEPYPVVRAFLYYLYTDSITPHPEAGPSLEEVAGMLVMSNCYDMPRLRTLCRNRLGRELDVEHAAIIWERAGTANEEWLKKRAARFCMTHWGRVVRTFGFQSLRRSAMMELCQEVDTEGRVVGSEELEVVGGLGGARFGASSYGRDGHSRRVGSAGTQIDEVTDGEEEDTMEM